MRPETPVPSPSVVVLPAPRSFSWWTTLHLADRIALGLIALALVLVFALFDNYGLGWDDYAQRQYGRFLLDFYASAPQELTEGRYFLLFHKLFGNANIYLYGGAFEMIAALFEHWLPFEPFETRRLLGGLIGVVGVVVTWRLGRRLTGPFGGLATVAFLVTSPHYVGQVFMNSKDGPFAVAMVAVLYAIVRLFEEFPRPRWRTVALLGVLTGLALGVRIGAVIGLWPALIGFAVLLVATAATRGLAATARDTLGFVARALLALPLAYAVMIVLWPWAAFDPLNPLVALKVFAHHDDFPWKELFFGVPTAGPDMPRSYVPAMLLLKLPTPFLIAVLLGFASAILAILRPGSTASSRAAWATIVAFVLTPVVIAVIIKPTIFNGIRHFTFLFPAMAILGGLAVRDAVALFADRGRVAAGALAVLTGLGVSVQLWDVVRLHPYEYVFFNRLIGGVAGARDQFMIDYWGLSFKEAADELKERIEARGEAPPGRKRWRVAVCGPHKAAEVALGPDFETTYETKNVDFALMLNEFYCAKLPHPVLVTIEREGVVLARVYNVRGRDFTSVFARP